MFKNGKKTLSFLLAIAMIATLIPANIAFASTAEKGTALADRSGIETDIRFALFGDTHVTAFPDADSDWTSPSVALDGIMDAYKTIDANMDAFVMPGDVIYNVQPSLEKTTDDVVKYNAVLAEINEEFPTASTYEAEGKTANIIWSMGNHEITLGANKGTATTGFTAGTWEQEVADNHAKYEEALKRKPIDTYTVNGYTFVTSAPYDYLNNYVNPNDKTVMSAYETTIKGYLEAALNADPAKPVFYLQHEAIDATNIASNSTIPTRNSAEFREFVVNNPRIITLSGHSHYAANDPRTFLQLDNGSTHINIPATRGSAGTYGTTKDSVTDNAIATQGMLVEVTGAVVTVRAFDYVDKKYIGEPYVFTAGAAAKTEYTKAGREAAKTSEVNKAYFESGAAITVSNIKANSAKISFPEGKKDGESATGLHDDYVHYYRVSVANKATGNVVKSYSMLGSYHINSTDKVNYSDSKYPALRKSLDRELSVDGLLRNTTYTVTVTPESALGQQGTPLTVDFTTSADKTAAELALTTKKTVNVAEGKTVTGTIGDASQKAAFVNGNKPTTVPGDVYDTFAKDSYITVDLGKQYAVNKVVLTVPGGSNNAKQNYKLEISTDPDFPNDATKTKLLSERGGVANMSEATEFVDGTTLTAVLDGTKSYRYVRYSKTAEQYSYLSELEVYADEYLTDVTKNATATASESWGATTPPSKVLDGKVTESNSWWSGWNSKYNWLQIDLGASLPVSMIQVDAGPDEGADNFTDAASQEKWRVYGSNTVATQSELLDSTTITAEGYDLLAYTGFIPYYDPEGPVHSLNKGSSATSSDTGIARSVFDGTPYQYITLKHATDSFVAIGEVTIWAINPSINSAVKTNDGLLLNFSEIMDETTINSENIKFYNASGEEITGVAFETTADGYNVAVTGADDAFKMELSYAVKSKAGMELAGELVKYFESNLDLSGKPVIVEENINFALNRVAKVDKTSETVNWSNITDGKTSTQNSAQIAKNGAITIDLEKSYNIKKIVIDVPSNSQGRQTYKIQVSNDPNFADGTTKTLKSRGAVSKLSETTEWVNGTTLTIELDGSEFYRYVRYLNTTGSADGKYLYMNEFEVWADRNLMEISRGASTTTNAVYLNNDNYASDKVVDGKNTASSSNYLSGWNDAYNWVNIDLGVKVPVVRVELESPYDGNGGADFNARRAWGVYGSNIAPNADDIATGVTKQNSGCYELTADGYTKLGRTNYLYPSYNSGNFDEKVYYTFKECETAQWTVQNGILRLDTFGQYQHIMLHRGLTGAAVLGEARVYTIAPKAAARLNGNTITVNFSEKIFPSYMVSDNFTLYDSENNLVAYSNATAVDDDTFTFDVADLTPGATYKVVVDKGVKSVTSMPLNIDNEITIVVPNISTTVTVKATETDEVATDFVAGTAYNFDVAVASPYAADEPNVKVVVAQYNGDQLVKAELADITAVANTTTNAVLTNFTYAEGNTFKVFAWKANFDEPYCAVIELGIQE